MKNNQVTISALNKYIKYVVNNDENLRNIEVVGEVSNYTPHHSKHMYFTLKDDESRIDCVMFASNANNVSFSTKNGDKVIVKGYVDVYPPTGKYQLYVTRIDLDGQGDLTKRFEILKEKLIKEGLFDSSEKQVVPKYPQKIGVITATSGAAIRDILSTIERRYPLAEVTIFRSIVQGEKGCASLINSLNLASQRDLDVVIIGRGGGSIEDLWNFNEEALIRRIFDFKIPIISGVGHETDFTLCDFVCDVRAETPTAAAVIATPNKEDVLNQLGNVETHISNLLVSKLSKLKLNVYRYNKDYFVNKLKTFYLSSQANYVNELKRLDDALNLKMTDSKKNFELISSKSLETLLSKHLIKSENSYKALTTNINFLYEKIVERNFREFEKNVGMLEQLSPLKILSRGYSISYSDGQIVKSVSDVNDNLHLVVTDGYIDIEILKKEVKKNE